MQLDAHDMSALQAASGDKIPPASRVFVKRPHGFTMVEMLVVVVILVILAGIVLLSTNSMQENSQETVAKASLQGLRSAVTGGPAGPGYYSDLRGVPNYSFNFLRVEDLFIQPTENNPASATLVPAYDPNNTKHGWRGPYISDVSFTYPNPSATAQGKTQTWSARGFSSVYGTTGAPALLDPWQAPIVIQIPALNAGDPKLNTAEKCRLQARLISAGPDGVIQTPLNIADSDLSIKNNCGDDIVLFLFKADERLP